MNKVEPGQRFLFFFFDGCFSYQSPGAAALQMFAKPLTLNLATSTPGSTGLKETQA